MASRSCMSDGTWYANPLYNSSVQNGWTDLSHCPFQSSPVNSITVVSAYEVIIIHLHHYHLISLHLPYFPPPSFHSIYTTSPSPFTGTYPPYNNDVYSRIYCFPIGTVSCCIHYAILQVCIF